MNDTKEHIMQIAFRLFLCKSFKEVTMKELVSESGVSKGAFYHYFESKEQLFQEVLDTYYLQMQGPLLNDHGAESLYDFIQVLSRRLDQMVQYLRENFSDGQEKISFNYLLMPFDAMNIIPEFKTGVESNFKQEISVWTQVIDEAKTRGEIRREEDSEALAKAFVFVNDGAGLRTILQGREQEAAEEVRKNWMLLYQLIKT